MAVEGPFGTLFQLGYVTRDIDQAFDAVTRDMGAEPIDLFREYKDGEGNPVMLRNLAHFRMGGLEVEMIEPRLDWESIYLDALPADGEAYAFHHLGYRVDSEEAFDRALAHAQDQGLAIDASIDAPNLRLAYFDTRRSSGHYTEVVLFRGERAAVSAHNTNSLG